VVVQYGVPELPRSSSRVSNAALILSLRFG
jgi:hypothetical protein